MSRGSHRGWVAGRGVARPVPAASNADVTAPRWSPPATGHAHASRVVEPPAAPGRLGPRLRCPLLHPGAGGFEARLERVDLRAPRGLERQLDEGRADRAARARAIVLDLQNIGALRGDEGGEAGERAGLVAQEHAQAYETAVLDETPLDDARYHRPVHF